MSNGDLTSSFQDIACNGFEFGNIPSKPKPKRKASRMPEFAARILKHWFEAHSDHPYPTKEEKASLKEQTGLTSSQLSTWFANARRRRKSSLSSRDASVKSPTQACLPVPPPLAVEDWRSMSPLDRWRHSPPEVEAAPLTAIMNIVAGSVTSESSDVKRGDLLPVPDDSQHYVHLARRPTPSVASSESAGSKVSSSSGSSAHSLNSNHSHGSFGRFYADEPSRRRRRRKIHSLPYDRPNSATDRRQFQCTFCTDTFKSKRARLDSAREDTASVLGKLGLRALWGNIQRHI